MRKQAIIEIDEANNIAYIYLQPGRVEERGAVKRTGEYENDSSVIQSSWREINVDDDDEGNIFGIELIGFKLK